VIGNILVFLGFHYSSVEEDELDLLKWGANTGGTWMRCEGSTSCSECGDYARGSKDIPLIKTLTVDQRKASIQKMQYMRFIAKYVSS